MDLKLERYSNEANVKVVSIPVSPRLKSEVELLKRQYRREFHDMCRDFLEKVIQENRHIQDPKKRNLIKKRS